MSAGYRRVAGDAPPRPAPEQTGLFLCYAVYTAAIHRWLNRKYFREARDALLAAEAALAQEPAAAAGVTTAG